MAGVPPKAGEAYTLYFSVTSQADTDIFQANPTIAAGDFKVSNDGGANFSNPGTLPSVVAGSTKIIQAPLASGEMTPSTGDAIIFIGSDAAGSEWQDILIVLTTTTREVDDLAYPTTSGRSIDVDANGGVEVGAIQNDIITAASIASGAIDADAIAADAITASKLATDCITSDELAASALTEIAASVWDRLITALTTAGSVGKLIVDNLAASGSLAAAVWNNSTRTLTQSAASVTATVSGSNLTITRGDTFTASLTGVGSLAGRSKLWVTFRRDRDDPDSYSLAQIEEMDGLIYVNGAAATTAANGSITVTDEDDGDLTIVIDEAETVNFARGEGHYDVQVLIGGAVTTKSAARYAVAEDVTRAIS